MKIIKYTKIIKKNLPCRFHPILVFFPRFLPSEKKKQGIDTSKVCRSSGFGNCKLPKMPLSLEIATKDLAENQVCKRYEIRIIPSYQIYLQDWVCLNSKKTLLF